MVDSEISESGKVSVCTVYSGQVPLSEPVSQHDADVTMNRGTRLPPLIFEPVLRRIRWGGRKLQTLLGKSIGPESDFAESWEIADHTDGTSRVASGPLAGVTLPELLRQSPEQLLGRQAGLTQFPLLIKFLDANDWLSLQVHPDDVQAKSFHLHENGKTESWIILQADAGSRIAAGLRAGVTAEQLRGALGGCDLEDLLHMIPVAAGDCIFVPAGTVHALGPGIVLAEIQQQSNLTFRLHDWGRLDASGQARPIHVEESIACTDFERGPVNPVIPVSLCDNDHAFEELVRCPFFVIRRHESVNPFGIPSDRRFRILMTLSGSARVETSTGDASLETGKTVLLPACSEQVRVFPMERLTILEVSCP